MNMARPKVFSAEHVGFTLQLLTAILIIFASVFVSLQLDGRFGVLADNFDALTF